MDKNILEKVKDCRLMQGVIDVEKLLRCFGAHEINRGAGQNIVGYGEKAAIIIIISGKATVISEDYFGNRNIISKLSESGIYGAAFVYSGHEVTSRLVADTDVKAVVLDGEKLHSPCDECCGDHTRFLYNTVRTISQSCVGFLEKAEHLSRRTTRDKALSYLTAESIKQGSDEFIIPFSRQELADYLAVDRSALSSELGHMQSDGLIEFKRSKFKLNKRD